MPGTTPVSSEWTTTAVRDRFSSTLFLAALFHGIVILGVSFTAGPLGGPAPTALEVVLVTGDSLLQDNPDARLLAQQNLAGSGTTRENTPLRTAPGATVPAPLPGPARPGSDQLSDSRAAPPNQAAAQVVATTGSPLLVSAAGIPEDTPLMRQGFAVDQRTDLLGRLDEYTRIHDSSDRELTVSANTREARVAPWLGAWKRRVEQFGTLNFPQRAQQRADAPSPVLEVAIGADGRLREITIQRSSGDRELDQAAIEILRAAAPFQPFPPELRSDYDVLRFSYEWHFSHGPGALRTAQGR